MAVGVGNSGEMAIVLRVKDDGSVVVEKFGKNAKDAMDKAGKGADDAAKKWDGFSDKTKKHAKIIAGAVLAVSAAAIYAGAQYEQAIANVSSVAGANEIEMAKISRAARDQAKVSVFSATQAAEAQYSLASAGFNTNQIIAAQGAVMTLAAATQSDLAQTSEITAATLSQFSLKAEDSSRVANVFAASISGSQATLQKLGDAMRYVGPVANALDMDIESTTAAISLLFNAGFRGEQAGTMLRASMIALQKPSSDAAGLIADMGLKINDANGKFVGFESLIDQLAGKQMTLNDAATLFGAEAAPGMLAMVKQGSKAYADMRDKITDTNKAQELASKQTDTLTGDWKLFMSSMEENALIFFDDVGPGLREVVKGITDMHEAMGNSLPGTEFLGIVIKDIASTVVAASTSFRELGTVIGGVAAASVQFFSGEFDDAGATLSRMVDDVAEIQKEGDASIERIWETMSERMSRKRNDRYVEERDELEQQFHDKIIAQEEFINKTTELETQFRADLAAIQSGSYKEPDKADGSIDAPADDGLDGGRGERERMQTELLREQLAEQVDIIAESQMTERELLFEDYAEQQFLLDEALELKAISEQRYNDVRLAANEKYAQDLSKLESKADADRAKAEQAAQAAQLKSEQYVSQTMMTMRGNVYDQSIALLRRFADDNQAIAYLLIALQTTKAVKDIQINAASASAQVLAYGQVEAAAHSAMFNYPMASAALARAAASVAAIEGTAAISTTLAIATGVVDAAQVNKDGGTGAPGSVNNPVNTTSGDDVAFYEPASEPVYSPTSSDELTSAQLGVSQAKQVVENTFYLKGVFSAETIRDEIMPLLDEANSDGVSTIRNRVVVG